MKKLLSLAVLVLVANAGFGQVAAAATTTTSTTASSPDVALAVFDAQNFDFGKIKQGQPVTHEFTFTNKGKVTMVITGVQASCGCTTPAWSKDPIPPGATGFVKATFNAASPGAFNKNVTVTANVESGTILLNIRGEVVVVTPQ